jgi:hypothetical protein
MGRVSATRRFADCIIGTDHARAGVLPAYPSSGQQFIAPSASDAAVHVLMSNADEGAFPTRLKTRPTRNRSTASAHLEKQPPPNSSAEPRRRLTGRIPGSIIRAATA